MGSLVLVDWSCFKAEDDGRLVGKTCRTPDPSSSVTVSIFLLAPSTLQCTPMSSWVVWRARPAFSLGIQANAGSTKSFFEGSQITWAPATDGPLVDIRHTCRRKACPLLSDNSCVQHCE
jgi:hypothetical protein